MNFQQVSSKNIVVCEADDSVQVGQSLYEFIHMNELLLKKKRELFSVRNHGPSSSRHDVSLKKRLPIPEKDLTSLSKTPISASPIISTTSTASSSKSFSRKRSASYDDDNEGYDKKYPLSKRAHVASIERSFEVLKQKMDTKDVVNTTKLDSLASFSFGLQQGGGGLYAEEWSEKEKERLIMVAKKCIVAKSLPPKKRFQMQKSP